MSKMTKVDTAIKVVEFNLKNRRERVDQLSKKMEPTAKEKIFIGQELELINNVEILVKAVTTKFNESLGKIPPMAQDLEEAVIGAVLLEKNAAVTICSFLLPEHFSSEPMQVIYETVLEMVYGNIPIDMKTVVIELRKKDKLDIVGGPYTIAEITSKVSSAANIEYHGRVIVELAMLRRFITLGSDLMRMSIDMKDVFEVLEFAEEEIKRINSWIKPAVKA